MERFLSGQARDVIGTTERVRPSGVSGLSTCAGMMHYLWAVQVLLKDFAAHAQELSRQIKEASEALAQRAGRPLRYLASSALDKEAIAREIAAAHGIEQGLTCILSAIQSYEVVRGSR